MTDVSLRTAFITGGANGIGLGIARALARAGAKLALVDVDAEGLARASLELSPITEVVTAVLDVRDREQFALVADDVETRLGPVSLLFNNAGVAGGAAATTLTFDLWDWGIGINLGGVINGVQTFLPRMAARGLGGHIVNTASGAGLVEAGAGVLYHTAKFAVVGMSEALRVELHPIGIGVSVLCPGPVATNIVERTRLSQPHTSSPRSDEDQQSVRARLAEAAAFLATGASPDAVGEQVLNAVLGNELFIHTDRLVIPLIERRTKALLDAMPPAQR